MRADFAGVSGSGAVGPVWFGQEFMGEFVDNGTETFGTDLVEAAVDDGFAPLDL
jgi:hypothetical protein